MDARVYLESYLPYLDSADDKDKEERGKGNIEEGEKLEGRRKK